MKRLVWLVIGVVLTLFYGCQPGSNAHTSYNPDADFSKFRTFAWLPKQLPEQQGEQLNDVMSLYNNELIELKIKRMVNSDLLDKGLYLDSLNPDLLFTYSIVMENRERYTNTPLVVNQPNLAVPRFYNYFEQPFTMYNYLTNDYNIYPYTTYFGGVNIYNTTPDGIYYGAGIYRPQILGNISEKVQYKEGTLVIDVIDRKTNQLIWRGYSSESLNSPSMFENLLPSQINGIMEQFPSPYLSNGLY
ncbi:MAG: DUF4136 domain-containing protein [Sporocytophaga sp.]|uniref:DUF4136 domain-containing protein n=1 Tax=Sporocytophaga sp. TaxID=2231183 RepID=UPI001B01C89D|nr:DUF4136 domain-containing protein [Sporocytophaga sp.]MBO9700952.1 DUF4136 domain-containing protein [Sporocytophaga sp.]